MSLAHGQDASNNLVPLLVDASGRAIVVAGGTFTVSGVVTANQGGTWSVTADTELPAAAALADTTANPTAPATGEFGHDYNGATWDRRRNNTAEIVFASAVRNGTVFSTRTNHNRKGIVVLLDITAVPGVQTVTLNIFAVRPDGAGTAYLMLTSGALATTGVRHYLVYPAAVTAGVYTASAILPLPRDYLLQVVHSGGGNFTYTVQSHLLE